CGNERSSGAGEHRESPRCVCVCDHSNAPHLIEFVMATATAPAATFRHDATVISLVGFCHGTSHFFHFVLPTLFPWLMRDFDLTFTQVGATMTVFFVVSGIGQALAGFVVDRFGAL